VQGCRDRGEIKRLILTCSGGPFYGLTREQLAGKTRADALRHPNWTMGAKITVDSATLMNKGLEIIEAMRLYRLPLRQVDAIIHRQSIVHSLVEYRDGAMLAQLGTPDMKLPIRYAMTYPYRAETPDRTLDLLSCPPLTFAAPDEETFRCLKLARQCAAVGGTACAILNGANEEAVGAFLRDAVGFAGGGGAGNGGAGLRADAGGDPRGGSRGARSGTRAHLISKFHKELFHVYHCCHFDLRRAHCRA